MGAKIKRLLAEGQVVRVVGVGQLCSPKLIEIIGLQKEYDAVWLDQEHAGLTIEQVESAARAARISGLDSFVRLNATDYASLMRPLEAGSGGIMAAQVRTVAEANDIVQWSKFHPEGIRGVNGTGVDGRFGTLPIADYFLLSNQETFVAIQIENAEALGNVDEIGAVPGVDVLFIGPADLSQSMGIPGQWDHPELWKAFESVAKAAERNKIHWAILPLSPQFATRCIDLGCKMLSIGMDVWIVQQGLRANLQDYQTKNLK